MTLANSLYTFLMYLIHPIKSHDFLMGQGQEDFLPKKLSLYESLSLSWAFMVINGIVKIWLMNFVIFSFFQFTNSSDSIIRQFYSYDGVGGFYFLILITILDVIFFPLVTLVIIQFWELVIRGYAKVFEVQNNVIPKIDNLMSVVLSSYVLMIIPVFGGFAQNITQLFLMYTGLRKQLGFRSSVCILIMLTPYILAAFLVGLIAFMFMMTVMFFSAYLG